MLAFPFELASACFYCGSFTRNDARIEHVLSAVEAVVQRRLTHYAHTRTGRLKAIPGDRTSFVSQWLPGLNEKFGSQSLCARDGRDSLLLVTLDNIRSLPGLLGKRGEPFNGVVQVNFLQSGPFTQSLVKGFADVVTATGSFHALLTSHPLQRQRPFTRQKLAAELEQIEHFRARSEALWKAHYEQLMKAQEKYVYDLETPALTGVTPDGKTFDLMLHWLNYWSADTAVRLRFPDEALDQPLQGLYERLPAGWLVKLTAEPPDLGQPADRDRLQWAYNRFASLA